MSERLLTIDDVADRLAVSTTTLRSKKFRDRLGLDVIRIGKNLRFRQSDIDNLINKNTECASQHPN